MAGAPFWRVAAASAAANAGVHAYLAPMHWREEPYIGALFVLGAILLAAAVAGLCSARTRRPAWLLGAAVSLGMCAGYVASRTVGLPNGYHEGWDDPFGTACLLLEATYGVVFVAAMGNRREPVSGHVALSHGAAVADSVQVRQRAAAGVARRSDRGGGR